MSGEVPEGRRAGDVRGGRSAGAGLGAVADAFVHILGLLDSLVHANRSVRKQFGGFVIHLNLCYCSLYSPMLNLI